MNDGSMLVAALVMLPAAGLVIWAWFAVTRVDAELRSLTRFDGLHLEI